MSASHVMSTEKPPRPICGARKKDGNPCRSTATCANGRCKVHGGMSVSGPALPQWIDGRSSKLFAALPRNLAKIAKQSQLDPTRLELQAELGVLHAMLYDSLKAWDAGGGDAWKQSQTLWEQYRAARDAKDADTMATTIEKLEALAATGYADYRAREETRKIIQDIRRVGESERKRMIEAELMLSADQVQLLMAKVTDAIMGEVTDPQVLARLHRRFSTFLGDHRAAVADRVLT